MRRCIEIMNGKRDVRRSSSGRRPGSGVAAPRACRRSRQASPPLFFDGAGAPDVLPAVAGPFACPRRKSRGDGAPKGATNQSTRLCPFGRRRARAFARGASPLGAPSRRFRFPGPRFLGEAGLARPRQRSSSRRGRNAARAGSRNLPSAGLRGLPAGAASSPALACVSWGLPRSENDRLYS